jgi:hypothetical protein
MDLCSLEDAFPNFDTGSVHKEWQTGSGFPYVGGTDAKPTKEERRAARKLAKKLKGPSLKYSEANTPSPTDPDRPGVKRMETVESMSQDEYKDYTKATNIPVLPKASCLFSETGTPSYFGNNPEEETDGFSSFSAIGGDNPNYMLEPDFSKTFDLKGVEKAGHVNLPDPNLEDAWKPMTAAANYTAYVPDNVERKPPGWSMNAEQKETHVTAKTPLLYEQTAPVNPEKKGNNDDRDVLLRRINDLVGRLENLEKKKLQNSQTEILMFVGTGMFLLLSFEILSRH